MMLDGVGNGWWAVMCRCQKQAITLILFALFSPTLFFVARENRGLPVMIQSDRRVAMPH